MRKVVQCILLKTMAALEVLEDIVNGAIGRERVFRDREGWICWHMMTTGSSAVLRAILLELCAELWPALERNSEGPCAACATGDVHTGV